MTRYGLPLILLACGFSLMGPAMALGQTPGILDEIMNSFSSGGDNLSNLLLSRIFGCQMFDHAACNDGQGPVIVSLIRIFNILCIALGAALFGWFLATGITQTAHEGKVLGARYSSLWAPIRSLVGLGMLMPVGDEGYNTIQVGIGMFVKGSTFAASIMWGLAADRIITFQDGYILPDMRFDATVIEPLWQMEVCAAMGTKLLESIDEGSTHVYVSSSDESCYEGEDGELVCNVTVHAEGNPTVINANSLHRADGCGVLSLPRVPAVLTNRGNPALTYNQGVELANRFRTTHLEAIGAVQESLQPLARELVDHVRAAPDNQDPERIALLSESIREAGQVYSNRLNNGLNPLLNEAGTLGGTRVTNARDRLGLIMAGAYSSACRREGATTPYAQAICSDQGNQGQGWLGAGAWYMHMARFADDGFQIKNARPTFQATNLEEANRNINPDVWPRIRSFLFGKTLDERQVDRRLEEDARKMTIELEKYWESAWISAVETGTDIPLEMIRGVREIEGRERSFNQLRQGFQNVTWEFLRPDPDRDPMIGIASLGRTIAETGLVIIGGSLGTQIASFIIPGGITWFLGAAGKITLPIGFSILMVGQTLSSIMPVLPSLIWVAAVTGYFLIIAEAIIAVNLWAVMHFRMDGEGLSGPAAQQGYLLVMSLSLTPVLMVFGFILGMGIFKISTTLINIGFHVVLDGVAQGQSLLTWIIGNLLIGILMIVVYFVLAERSFSLTAELPGRILRWVGGDSQLMGGEADRIRVAAAAAGHQVVEQGRQATQTLNLQRKPKVKNGEGPSGK